MDIKPRLVSIYGVRCICATHGFHRSREKHNCNRMDSPFLSTLSIPLNLDYGCKFYVLWKVILPPLGRYHRVNNAAKTLT